MEMEKTKRMTLKYCARKSVFLYILSLTLFIPQLSFAELKITEIMYNPDGSDTGREWVEICNLNTASAVDLSQFKLWEEKDKTHSLSLDAGNGILGKDACAVVTDDVSKFKTDFPNYSYGLFTTSGNMGLVNYGEMLKILDSSDAIIDEVTYAPDSGADNTGKTLNLINGVWQVASSTPGYIDSANATSSQTSNNTGSSSSSGASNVSNLPINEFNLAQIEPPQDIFIRTDITDGFAGELINFPVEVFDATGKAVSDAKITISYGDDVYDANKNIFQHRYKKSGKYTVRIFAQKDTLTDELLKTIEIKNNPLSLYYDSNVISIQNTSELPVNLEGMILRCGFESHMFQDMYIASNTTLDFDKKDYFKWCNPKVGNTIISLTAPGALVIYGKDNKQQLAESASEVKTSQLSDKIVAGAKYAQKEQVKSNIQQTDSNTKAILGNTLFGRNVTDIYNPKSSHFEANTDINNMPAQVVQETHKNANKVSQVVQKSDKNVKALAQPVQNGNTGYGNPFAGVQIANAQTIESGVGSNGSVMYIWIFGVLFLGAFASLAYIARDPLDDWEFEEEK